MKANNKCRYKKISNPWINPTKQPKDNNLMMYMEYATTTCTNEKLENSKFCSEHQELN